jgi:hypothetical protein
MKMGCELTSIVTEGATAYQDHGADLGHSGKANSSDA